MVEKPKTLADAMLEVFRAHRIEHIFSSPGSEWVPMWDALARAKAQGTGPVYVNTRHEDLAVAIATGYHFATGKLPAVVLHTGVGTLHGAMALRAAAQQSVPMVVLAGESAGFGQIDESDPGQHWSRALADVGGPAALARPIVKWSGTVTSREVLLGMVQDACRLALTPPIGPVFLSVPLEFTFTDWCPPFDGRCAPPPLTTHADGGVLEQVAHELREARLPVLITEYAGRDPRNVELLVSLAERLAIPVVEGITPNVLNFPRDHELHQGYNADEFLGEADLVLAVGNRMPWYPHSKKPKHAKVIIIDDDPSHQVLPFWGFCVDAIVNGDLNSSLRRLNEIVARAEAEHSSNETIREERRKELRERHEKQIEQARARAQGFAEKRPMEGAWATLVIGEELPREALVVEETITHKPLIMRHVPRFLPSTFYSQHTGGLGLGLGAALGFKYADPARLTAVLIGDGAFNYNPVLPAFGFAQQFKMPILVILMNNESYAAMKRSHLRSYSDGWAAGTNTFFGSEIDPTPDYVHVAQAFGGYGERVEDPQVLRSAIRRAIERVEGGQLALLDVILRPDVGTQAPPVGRTQAGG